MKLETNNIAVGAGLISRNLTYCQLLSGRIALARSEAQKYGRYFIKDTIGRLMNIAKQTAPSWWLFFRLGKKLTSFQ